jgi:hypothetical protein
MSQDEQVEFGSQCQKILGSVLARYGYVYRATYSRPRGLAAEFEESPHILFVEYEEGSLAIELIVSNGKEHCFRADINLLLWINGVKFMVDKRPYAEKLELFAECVDQYCGALLRSPEENRDNRYCFDGSCHATNRYVSMQRGEL